MISRSIKFKSIMTFYSMTDQSTFDDLQLSNSILEDDQKMDLLNYLKETGYQIETIPSFYFD